VSTPPAIVAFAAPSGTGKTTFLETLIRELVGRGLKVAAIKHDAHSFQVDRPGKDTHRFRSAGASRVAISNDRELAVMGDTDPDLTPEQLTSRYLGEVDLVLVEGFREAIIPRVLVCRRDAPRPPYDATEPRVIAVVGDRTLPGDKPHFPLDDPAPLADFLTGRFGLR
jgi:molybdopterin-guanine dinucleotide biosynthesis adapter protein